MIAGQMRLGKPLTSTRAVTAAHGNVCRRVPTAAARQAPSISACAASPCQQPALRLQTQFGQAALSSGAGSLAAQQCRERQQITAAPRAADGGGEALSPSGGKKTKLPIMWRVAAALTYLIPWIDSLSLGREVYHMLPSSIVLYFLPGPAVGIYYCSQFAPLVIFFLLFLAVVKNTKIPHFVRFNCMQSVMIDIIVMLFTIVRSYFPSELRWTAVLTVFDNFSYMACMCPVLYCVYYCLRGKYADMPLVSESVYMQVEASEYM